MELLAIFYIFSCISIGLIVLLLGFLLSYIITKVQMLLDNALFQINFSTDDFKHLYDINFIYIMCLHLLLIIVIYSTESYIGAISLLYKFIISVYLYIVSIIPMSLVYKVSHIDGFLEKPIKPLLLNIFIIFIVFLLVAFVCL